MHAPRELRAVVGVDDDDRCGRRTKRTHRRVGEQPVKLLHRMPRERERALDARGRVGALISRVDEEGSTGRVQLGRLLRADP